MVTRRQAREWAVMMLCECDLNPPCSIDGALSAFWEMQHDVERNSIEDGEYGIREAFTVKGKKHAASLVSMIEFAEQRIKGVLARKDELDAALEPFLDHWQMYRLGTVDRNVLRLGAWELAYDPEQMSGWMWFWSVVWLRKCNQYKTIKEQYQTLEMQTRTKNFTGWTAQIIQHEVDHCNGVLI